MTDKEFKRTLIESYFLMDLRSLYKHYEVYPLYDDEGEPYPYEMWLKDILEHIRSALAL